VLTVTRYAHSIEVEGASPPLTIALRGNNLSDTGVRIALPPLKPFFVKTPSANSFFVTQTRFLSHGGKLVIDRAEGSWYKRQQHRIIPQDSGSRCCLDSERTGGVYSPFCLAMLNRYLYQTPL
jgi:hypothetical protein